MAPPYWIGLRESTSDLRPSISCFNFFVEDLISLTEDFKKSNIPLAQSGAFLNVTTNSSSLDSFVSEPFSVISSYSRPILSSLYLLDYSLTNLTRSVLASCLAYHFWVCQHQSRLVHCSGFVFVHYLSIRFHSCVPDLFAAVQVYTLQFNLLRWSYTINGLWSRVIIYKRFWDRICL